MNGLDRRIRGAALRAVRRVSTEQVTYRRRTAGGYDPETRAAAQTLTEVRVNALAGRGDAEEGRGGVEAGEIVLSVPAAQMPFEPSVGDELCLDDGTAWKVVGVQAEYATSPNAVAMWLLRVRRG